MQGKLIASDDANEMAYETAERDYSINRRFENCGGGMFWYAPYWGPNGDTGTAATAEEIAERIDAVLTMIASDY